MNSSSSSSTDKLVFYASIFMYQPRLKQEFALYNPSIQQFECKNLFYSIYKHPYCYLEMECLRFIRILMLIHQPYCLFMIDYANVISFV